MIDREFAQNEYDHARQQLMAANAEFAAAQRQIQEGQQAAAKARDAALVADGACQQAKAFLDRFPPEFQKPATPAARSLNAIS
jgi:multidrug resistance efflux pump